MLQLVIKKDQVFVFKSLYFSDGSLYFSDGKVLRVERGDIVGVRCKEIGDRSGKSTMENKTRLFSGGEIRCEDYNKTGGWVGGFQEEERVCARS